LTGATGGTYARPTPTKGLERRLSFLHEQLRITPAQERLWIALTNVLHDEMQDGRDRRDFNERRGSASVVERLERQERRLADRTQRTDHILSVLRPLYASFSVEQKQTGRPVDVPGRTADADAAGSSADRAEAASTVIGTAIATTGRTAIIARSAIRRSALRALRAFSVNLRGKAARAVRR
jgi:hypothetical protein